MLGKYDEGASTSYISRAGTDHTYFDLGDKWNTATTIVNGNKEEMLRINKQFLDNQKAAKKEFYFSHNPELEIGMGTYMEREVSYFGIKNIEKIEENLWKVKK